MTLTSPQTTVAVLIPNYNGKHLLDDCIRSLLASRRDRIQQYIYVVDNASTDGSVEYMRERWPEVRIVTLDTNLGYAGGNNAGWEAIQRDLPSLSCVLLLNSDTIVEPDAIERLVDFSEKNPRCGAAQPALMLHPETAQVNSLGNRIHFLGFGYASCYGCDESQIPAEPMPVNYASGAAVLLKTEAIREVGLFDAFMFMYLEDLDLGWRLSLAGWDSYLVPESRIYHKFEFSRGMRQYYYFERNRLWILLCNYRLMTLLLILPAWLFMELGQIFFAVRHRRFGKKLAAYAFFFRMSSLRALRRGRSRIQRLRKRSDRWHLARFTGVIAYQPLESPLLRYIANPILSVYLRLLQVIVMW